MDPSGGRGEMASATETGSDVNLARTLGRLNMLPMSPKLTGNLQSVEVQVYESTQADGCSRRFPPKPLKQVRKEHISCVSRPFPSVNSWLTLGLQLNNLPHSLHS